MSLQTSLQVHQEGLLLDGDDITTVPILVQVPDQYFMDMRHDVITMDNAGIEITHNKPLQLVKHVSLTWLKCYLIYTMNEGRGDLSPDELNNLRKTDLNSFRCSYSEMPKLALVKPIHPAHPFLVASSSATNCKKIAKDERTQPPILQDISHLDKTDLESTAFLSTGDIQEVVDLKLMPGILVEEKSKVGMQKMIVSKLNPTTTIDDGISLAGKHDKEDNAQELLRQGQVEVYSMGAGYSQCKTSSKGVNKIVTTDDLAPDIGRQGMFEYAARGVTDNEADSTGYDEDDEQNLWTCVTRSDDPGIVEPSISLVKAEVPFKHPTSPQDLDTSVPYGQSIK